MAPSDGDRPDRRPSSSMAGKGGWAGLRDDEGGGRASTAPSQNDVLFGRGYAIARHPGNAALRAAVRARKPVFAASARTDKRRIAEDVVNDVRGRGGRFLAEDKRANGAAGRAAGTGDRAWIEVDFDAAVEKVMHRFREREAGATNAGEARSEAGAPPPERAAGGNPFAAAGGMDAVDLDLAWLDGETAGGEDEDLEPISLDEWRANSAAHCNGDRPPDVGRWDDVQPPTGAASVSDGKLPAHSSPTLSARPSNGAVPKRPSEPPAASPTSFYVEHGGTANGFPTTLTAFVRSGWRSVGGSEGVENAARVALALARAFDDSTLGTCVNAAQLDDFVVRRENGGAGGRWRVEPAPHVRRGRVDAPTARRALGRLLYSVFAGGEPPPPDLLAESSSPKGELDIMEQLARRFRSMDESTFSKLVEGGKFPVSICRLLSDLMSETESTFASLGDVARDLEQMLSNPRVFLHDSDSTAPVFGRANYGRKRESLALLEVTRRMADSTNRSSNFDVVETVFVSGIAGSGKSRLVHALGDALQSSGWVVIKAKFERGLEHASRRILSAMFDQLISHLVTMKQSRNPSDVAYSRCATKAIAESVGLEGLSSVADFLPSLSLLFERPLTHPYLGDGNERQLVFSLSKVIEAVLDSNWFLAICCDDLQWADKPTLTLLSELLVNLGGLKHISRRCLFAGLFRDNEIGDNHPLAIQMAYLQMMTCNINTTRIKVSSLSKHDIGDMLMMELRLPRRCVDELADAVQKKTSGHAFFVVELLNSLIRDSFIAYSPKLRCFSWDQDRINMLQTGDGVAALIVSNISSLPPASQRVLRILSCFGMHSDLSLLRILEKFEAGIVSALDDFVEQGILDRAGPIFMFAHDLILQAVYESVPMAEREVLHLELGEFLVTVAAADESTSIDQLTSGLGTMNLHDWEFFGGQSISASIISLACDQLNSAGCRDYYNHVQREKVANCNLAAGRKSLLQSDFHAARHYFSKGITFLWQECWLSNPMLCLALHQGAAIASSSLGEADDVASYADEVTKRASLKDSLAVQQTLLKALYTSGRHEECIARGLEILRRLDFDIPTSPTIQDTMKALSSTDAIASQYSIDQMCQLCEKTIEPSVHEVIRIVDCLFQSCYNSSSPMLPIIACEMMKFSFQEGIANESTMAFSIFAMLKIFTAGDYAAGRYWADAVRAIVQKQHAINESNAIKRFEDRPNIALYLAIDIWFSPARDISKNLLEYHKGAMKMGNTDVAMMALQTSWRFKLLAGENLSLIQQASEQRLELLSKHSPHATKCALLDNALMVELTGRPGHYFSSVFGGAVANMKDLQGQAKSSKDMHILQSSHVFNVLIHFWRGDYESAEESSSLASSILPAANMPTIYRIYHVFFRGLVKFQLYRKLGEDQRLEDGKTALGEVKKWAGNAAAVFGNKLLLLNAEYHASIGEHDAAWEMYGESIQASRDRGNVHELALAYELLGKHRSALGMTSAANECFAQAFAHYSSWGATAVADRLLQTHNIDVTGAASATKRSR
ncbi:hypothetical protein ACHAXT_009054 [Thalassiosira profunda]